MKTIIDKLEGTPEGVNPGLLERITHLKRHLRHLEGEPLTKANAAARKSVREDIRDIEAAIKGVVQSEVTREGINLKEIISSG